MTRSAGQGQKDRPRGRVSEGSPPAGISPREALRLYRDLGSNRSIPSLVDALLERFAGLATPPPRQLRQWARDGDWDRLCAIWDRENQADPLVTAWRQSAKQILNARNAPEPPTLQGCRALVKQVDTLFALVDKVEAEHERKRQARAEEYRREATTAKKRWAWIVKHFSVLVEDNPRPERRDTMALADRTIVIARRVTQALLRWSRRRSATGAREIDAGLAVELVLMRVSLEERIQTFKSKTDERRVPTEQRATNTAAIQQYLTDLQAACAAEEENERRDKERLERLAASHGEAEPSST